MRLLLLPVALTAATVLAGCATMTAEECVAADWRSTGYADASEGRPASHLSHHVSACADHGIIADEAAYAEGHADGARAYCTPTNAFRVGRRGGSHPGFCPDDLAHGFDVAYQDARGLYTRRRAVTDAETQLASLERSMSQLEARIFQEEAALRNPTLTPASRAQLQGNVAANRNQHQRLSKQRKRAQEKLDSAERAYNRYEARVEERYDINL